jgi:hypothetical protein
MSDLPDDLRKFYDLYRYLDPKIDLSTGNFNVLTSKGVAGTSADGEHSSTSGLVYDKYISQHISGEDLTGNLKKGLLKQSSPTPEETPGLFFNTVYQTKKDETTAAFLDEKYWAFPRHGAAVKGKGAESTTKEDVPYNFYAQVCGVNEKPATNFTINTLRSPFLTKARRNVDEIQTFLNYIPSTFASKMVPYLDVEFQLPLPHTEKGKPIDQTFLDKPSLLRFLLGSIEIPNLTAADKSLIQAIKTPSTAGSETQSVFVGMEMFTTPQTLTNMDALGVNSSRINQANPFLPPATLMGGSIQVRNAGAGLFTHKTANIDFKVHDKNRLTEFAEFVRGPAGYSNVTVWLTYGWLAPRSNTDEDIYAKFINHNMLVREAYMVKNAGFSFDATGQVTVKVELVSKAIGPLQTYSLDSSEDTNLKSIKESLTLLGNAVATIKEDAAVFGQPPEGMKDIRFYQILNAAGSGELALDIPYDELKRTIETAQKNLANNKSKKGKPIFSPEEIEKANNALDLILLIYSPEALQGIKTASRSYIKSRLDKCSSSDTKDPFLPIAAKDKYHSLDLIEQCSKGIPFTTEIKEKDLVKKSKLPQQPDKSWASVVSLGKLFCIFCLPGLLASAKNQDIKEVQVNFYQFNESCGPLSYANIAEFPIDLRLFYFEFQDFIENRGGESMTLQDFMQFVITNQVMDNRALGYGMKDFYQPLSADNIEAKQIEGDKKDAKGNVTKAGFDTKMSEWIGTYKTLKQPNIVMYAETVPIVKSNETKNLDLLQKIASTVGSYYNEPNFDPSQKDVPKMLRIHIYDKSYDPYAVVAQTILKNDSGGYTVLSDESAKSAFLAANAPAAAPAANVEAVKSEFAKYTAKGQVRNVTGGRDVLRNFVAEMVPTITYGVNGSMITNASLASKTDGLLGTINLLGGSQKSSSKLSENGLTQEENKLPMRIVPAQLTMTSLGCPIAEPYQSFYIDFGTGTTLDNLYASTQVAHTFSPGKFETSWTFAYADGYGKFFSATSMGEAIKKFNEDLAKAAGS